MASSVCKTIPESYDVSCDDVTCAFRTYVFQHQVARPGHPRPRRTLSPRSHHGRVGSRYVQQRHRVIMFDFLLGSTAAPARCSSHLVRPHPPLSLHTRRAGSTPRMESRPKTKAWARLKTTLNWPAELEEDKPGSQTPPSSAFDSLPSSDAKPHASSPPPNSPPKPSSGSIARQSVPEIHPQALHQQTLICLYRMGPLDYSIG